MKSPILILGAHSDDIEFGIGGCVNKLVQYGHNVICYIATTNTYLSLDGNTKREVGSIKETESSMCVLGINNLIMGSFTAQKLLFNLDLIVEIERIIQEYGVETIILPWRGDHHQDHRALHNAGMAAGRRVKNIYGYCSNIVSVITSSPFKPTKFIELSKENFNAKIKACMCYNSEWSRYNKDSEFPLEEIFKSRCIFYGQSVSIGLAEALEIYREVS